MHISEGVLSAPVLAAGAVLTIGGVAKGLRDLDYEDLPMAGLLAAAFFVATLIHVPIGPSAAHLVLNGLCGLLLGWVAFPVILVGLTLQAVLFQFGGLTGLGVNTFNMAFPAILAWLVCRGAINAPSATVRGVAEFAAGAGAILLSGILVAASLIFTGESFHAQAWLIIAAHIPVMIIEGLVTMFIVEFIRKVRPEMLPGARPMTEQEG
jgi:cobalt/nickel transport system permease protein